MSETGGGQGGVPEEIAASPRPVAVCGLVHVRSGCADAMVEQWRLARARMRDEPGFEQYVVHATDEGAAAFYLYERWASGPALVRHLQQPYMQELFGRLPDLLERPFQGRWVTPVVH